jgi:stage II sporulation protein M
VSLRDLLTHVREMKHYIIVAAATFILGIYLGSAESEQFMFFLQSQSERLRDIVEGMDKLEHSRWWLLFFIFSNNLIVCLIMVYAGAFFGIMPLFALITNGMLLGYLAEKIVPEEGWTTLLLGIVPHGIIEIPAIILACAYGIKFGTLTAKTLIFLPMSSKRSLNGKQFIRLLKISLPLALVLCGLLLSAAIIESTVTYALVR